MERRVLRIESVDSTGPTAKYSEHSRERSFRHTYVEGSLSGILDVELPPGVYIIDIRDHDIEFLSDPMDIPRTKWNIKIRIKDKAFQTDVVELGMSFVETIVPENEEDEPVILNEYGAFIKLLIESDERTRSVVYHLLESHHSDLPGLLIQEETCPYVDGPGGNVGAYIEDVFQYLTKEVQMVEAFEGNKTLRDRSIYDAIDDVSIAEINWLETLPELAHPIQFLRRLVTLFKVATTWQGWIRQLANLHLFWKYVIKTGLLTWSEIKKLTAFLVQGGIRKLPRMKVTGRGRTRGRTEAESIRYTYNTKVCYLVDTSRIDRLLDALALLRITPRLVDLWDIVPYSFVVDWLLPVEDAINHVETMNIQMRMPFVYAVLTFAARKKISRVVTMDNGRRFNLFVTIDRYERKVTDVFPPDVWLGITFQNAIWKKWITASALLAQRILKE
jgi:hypothetical protein